MGVVVQAAHSGLRASLRQTGFERALLIPSGLLLLFFGVFLLPLSASATLGVLAGRFALRLFLESGSGAATSLAGASLAGAAVAGAGLLLCARIRWAPGALTGAVVALSLAAAAPVNAAEMACLTGGLAGAFGAAYAAAPKEVAVFVSSYAGSFLVWHGLELIDGAVAPRVVAPAALLPDDADVWFSTLSFLVVGALGCAVQLILLGGSEGTISEREHYVPIP